MSESIPKHIHQIWWQGESNIPVKYHFWRESWSKYHPEWKFTLWDESKMNQFIETHEPTLLKSFLSWPEPIYRADAFRYVLLKHSGGWYVDMDIECLKSIDELQNNAEVILSRTIEFNNAIMGGIKGHSLWNMLVRQLPKIIDENNRYKATQTGPRYFSGIIEKYEFYKMPGVVCLPHYIFEPLAPYLENGILKVSKNTQNSYAIHYQTIAWMSKQQLLLSKLSDILFIPLFRLYLKLTKKKISFPKE